MARFDPYKSFKFRVRWLSGSADAPSKGQQGADVQKRQSIDQSFLRGIRHFLGGQQ